MIQHVSVWWFLLKFNVVYQFKSNRKWLTDLSMDTPRPPRTMWCRSGVVLRLHQALQVFDVPDGGPQRLHLAEPLVGAVARQVVPQLGVALVHTPHPLTLSLVTFLDESWFEGTLVHAEVSTVVEGGQVGQGALVLLRVRGTQEKRDGTGQRVFTMSSRRQQTDAQVGRGRKGGAHHVTCAQACKRVQRKEATLALLAVSH